VCGNVSPPVSWSVVASVRLLWQKAVLVSDQYDVWVDTAMARRYDSRTTTFSPEGRLYQVEYAVEAISNAGAVVGVLAKDGVVLVAEKKISSKVTFFPLFCYWALQSSMYCCPHTHCDF
jgi:hypothetical protein